MESVLSVEESLSVEETKNCLDKINSLFTYSDSLFSKGMNILDLQREIKS